MSLWYMAFSLVVWVMTWFLFSMVAMEVFIVVLVVRHSLLIVVKTAIGVFSGWFMFVGCGSSF